MPRRDVYVNVLITIKERETIKKKVYYWLNHRINCHDCSLFQLLADDGAARLRLTSMCLVAFGSKQ